MKRWDFACDDCGMVEEHFAQSRSAKIACASCGHEMRGLFPLVNIHGTLRFDLPYDWGAGRKFYSTKDREAWMKKNNLGELSNSRSMGKKEKKELPPITQKDLKDWGVS